MDDDDEFLYGDSELKESSLSTVAPAVIPSPGETPFSLHLPRGTACVFYSFRQNIIGFLLTPSLRARQSLKQMTFPSSRQRKQQTTTSFHRFRPPAEAEVVLQDNDNIKEEEDADQEAEAATEDGSEEADESDEDIEFIMEPANRSLDLRPTRPAARSASSTAPPKATHPSGPSLTTEYTPRERGAPAKPPAAQPPSTSTPTTWPVSTPTSPVPDSKPKTDDGIDPSALPPVTAPPSHPAIDPTATGAVEGRSIFEVDVAGLAEKAWRRPGSDISDWFNYGFDEISWEAYCYRRRELGDVAAVLKTNVVNFSGMPEDQLAQLPPELRTMVMTGATAMMANGGAPMMQPAMNPMMAPEMGNMNMGPQMMNPMMASMGGEMGMDRRRRQRRRSTGPRRADAGPIGCRGGIGVGMGMADYGLQNIDAPVAPSPPVGPSRGVPQGPFRGPRGMMMRGGRGGYMRGRGAHPTPPARSASPLPPNVPTGPRNQNKYKDRDNNAQAVDGLDYGGGAGAGFGGMDRGSATPAGDFDDRNGRKRRERSHSGDDRRDLKRR
ncbi:hypothetical protein H4582DRAFT_2125721 [Lactarius indigo]|nr:hypothetical protein H4582DRAFT_2125721 [Lactarius indigo]